MRSGAYEGNEAVLGPAVRVHADDGRNGVLRAVLASGADSVLDI